MNGVESESIWIWHFTLNNGGDVWSERSDAPLKLIGSKLQLSPIQFKHATWDVGTGWQSNSDWNDSHWCFWTSFFVTVYNLLKVFDCDPCIVIFKSVWFPPDFQHHPLFTILRCSSKTLCVPWWAAVSYQWPARTANSRSPAYWMRISNPWRFERRMALKNLSPWWLWMKGWRLGRWGEA